MRKLLIADSSAEFCEDMCEALHKKYRIKTAHDGIEAFALMQSFYPDFLILDPQLPRMDGISLLIRTSILGLRPITLIRASYFSDFLNKTMEDMSVAYGMYKNCPIDDLIRILGQLRLRLHPPISFEEQMQIVVRHFQILQMDSSMDGFVYAKICTVLWLRDETLSLGSELYPQAARILGIDEDTSMERPIRGVIDKAYAQCPDIWHQYFPFMKNDPNKRLKNRRFFSEMSNILQNEIVKLYKES